VTVRDDQDPEGRRPAFYALAPGGIRDWWTLLHPPYTLWHLSYVAIGAVTAPEIDERWLVETMVAFFLAMGIAAHALDELHGRPLGTHISNAALVAAAVVALAGAMALGVDAMVHVSPWLSAFIAVGVFLVVAYNMELFGGLFHSDLWFALAWGGFPVVTAAYAQSATIRAPAVVAAGACVALSAAQRSLSTPVRRVRRDVASVEGTVVFRDGTRERINAAAIRAAPESALRHLSIALPLLAGALVLARLA
jgi:hypothetical protein